MKLVAQKECTGCSSCLAACSRQAIQMAPSEDGFLFPEIDQNTCVECGACTRACPVLKDNRPDLNPLCFGARTRDSLLLQESSSGGIFSELARPVLKSGGCVFGCAMRSLCAMHIKIEDETGLAELRGSKYVQSDMRNCYQECKDELSKGRRVLFSGTPCQIAGLKSYLVRDYENLLCVALICHGVPSPKMFDQYLLEEADRSGALISNVCFRGRAKTGKSSFSIQFSDGRSLICRSCNSENVYIRAFLDRGSCRDSCLRCKFQGGNSNADIVLGDFWGVEQLNGGWSVQDGASAVLLYTGRGISAFNALAVDSFPVRYEDIARRNVNLDRNTPAPKWRGKFLKTIRHGGSFYQFFEKIDFVPLYVRGKIWVKDRLRPLYYRLKSLKTAF